MNGNEHKLSEAQWIAQCARRLREHWSHADVVALEEAAMDLWRDEELRALAPFEAAARWLSLRLRCKRHKSSRLVQRLLCGRCSVLNPS
jgi:hypothetical protein